MKEIMFTINQLEVCRYGITPLHNVTQVTSFMSPASSAWELTLNLTYEQLNLKLQQHFRIDADDADQKSATQQYRNHFSTLHSFLASVGKTSDGRVGAELGSGFDVAVRAYIAQLSVASRTQRDRRSHLRLIQRLYQEAMQTSRPTSPPTKLSLALRAEISKTGLAPKALSRQVGVSPSALQRWLSGAVPNRRGIPTLRRLEARLGLPRDQLVALLPKEVGRANDESVPPIEYRERARHLRQTALTLSVSELSARYLDEWWSLYEYKTCAMPTLERHPRGVWRCIPVAHHGPACEFSVRGGMVSPTADISFEQLRYFFGVLSQLPHRDGGLPADYGRTQTLAWCAHPLALSAYLDYLTRRSGGLRHNTHRTFCTFVAALLRPKTGFLWQQPDYRLRLPVALQPDAEGWQRMCERSERLLTDYKRTATDVSRDPKAPIANLLAQAQPLKPVLEAIERIEQAAAAAPPGGLTEAKLRRDALLMSMLLSNPLRVRAFITMTWKPDGTGVLRGSNSTGWRIHLQPTHLKNGASKAGKDYSVRVAKWVQPRLEAYLEEYRGTLLQGRESPYLFVSSMGVHMWASMQSHLAKLTATYIPGSPGFGPHAFRHLVATNWLQQHPNDFLTVAELLNDKLETVLANYAHLKRDLSFSRYEEHLERLMDTP